MKERLLIYARKYAPLVGYPVFYVVCLLIFAVLQFPYEKLKDRLVASYNAQQRGPNGQELQIDELHGYWLTGVRASGVRLLSPSSEANKPPSKMEINEATVRYSLLSAMVGTTWIGFDVYGMGGEVTGAYETNGNHRKVDASIDSLELGEVDPIVQLLGVPLHGKVAGEVHLDMPENKATKGAGSIAIEMNDVSVGDGKAKIKGLMALPKVDVGTLTLSAEAKDGLLKISKLVAGGKDVELQGEGRITMRDLAVDSLCDAQVRFKINDSYRSRSDITKSLFGAPGSNAPALFELADPRIKQSKRADGFYGWNLRGALGRLDFAPAAGGGAVPATPGLGALK
jgi:type II secretion system protein N